MKIIFSRKGFDSGSGGGPSPIVDNVPVSLPIPSGSAEPYRFVDVFHPTAGNLGDLVKGRKGLTPRSRCHFDPQLPWQMGTSALGQQGAAQSHLANQNVEKGDLFVFFGLFQSPGEAPHHRIFGAMSVRKIITLGPSPKPWMHHGLDRPHPHTDRPITQKENNTLYVGRGQMAHSAHPELRLTLPGENPSAWACPDWLAKHGLSYHANPSRWSPGRLDVVARGQEFVSDVGLDDDALDWVSNLWKLLTK